MQKRIGDTVTFRYDNLVSGKLEAAKGKIVGVEGNENSIRYLVKCNTNPAKINISNLIFHVNSVEVSVAEEDIIE